MARKPALKVFRTSIGFHDAYVAAPSQKAALEAWGAGSNLFAIGGAEQVTDPKLTAEPLASPGKVVRVKRGSLAEHLSAADAARPKRKSAPAATAIPTKPRSRPLPRPSRDRLAQAEADVEAERERGRAELADLEAREAKLRAERDAIERKHESARAKLERKVEQERSRYEKALDRWRENG